MDFPVSGKTKKYEILKQYFGHEMFRQGQEAAIDAILSGRDVICIMPTGGGKSMCYQIPALLLDGITLVISPLISLMHDQVTSLVQSGIAAAYINSSLTYGQFQTVLSRMKSGRYKLIYVAPERLETEEFIAACKECDISFVAVDEAHCVSHWGHDFRPSYLKIHRFYEKLSSRPTIGAFTATATQAVKNDIMSMLRLENPLDITTGFDRPNLFFSVIRPKSKEQKLLELLSERRSSCGIVYCATRSTVEDTCRMLCDNGFRAGRYHAGLPDEERRRNQEDFVYDRISVMVATNAFGMGIDKSNVSFVIHYDMPKSPESYYQEAGRAGRDGEEAECILLYSPRDVGLMRFIIEHSEPNEEMTEEQRRKWLDIELYRLKYMTYYCTSNECLRAFLLRYFGEKHSGACGKCSNCLSHYTVRDITVESQKVLSCVARMGQRFGVKMVTDVLRGVKNERISSESFDELSTYGIMKDNSESYVRTVINALLHQEFLIQTDGQYPVLRLTESSMTILRGEKKISARILKEQAIATVRSSPSTGNEELFERLKALRKKLAEKASVPAYVVFTDATLRSIAEEMPSTDGEFLQIGGVGRAKLDRYGAVFMQEIEDYKREKEGKEE